MSGSNGIVVGNPTPTNGIPGNAPPEGPKTLPLTIPFTNEKTTFTLNAYQLLQSGGMTTLQSMFVNNTASATPLTVTVSVSNNTTVIPAGECQWIAVLAPGGASITFTSTGGETVTAQITNFFVQPTGGGGGSGGGTYVNNALVVTDQALDSAIAANRVQTQPTEAISTDTLAPVIQASTSYSIKITTGSNTDNFTTGNPSLFIAGMLISISGDLSFGTSGTYLWGLYDNETLVAEGAFYVAGAAPAVNATLLIVNLTGLQYRTINPNTPVMLVLSTEAGAAATVTAGTVYATLFCAQTANGG